MKVVQTRALLLDALHQVLDNKVFRILLCLALLLPLLTALVHFREDEVVILFGWHRLSYDSFSILAAGSLDPRDTVISVLMSIVIDGLTGTFGILICLTATAFFVPQMIEKGAADVLFHKPLSRLTLYLWRYLAGLLFVALLATVTCAGTFLGLLVFSSYADPGILAAIATLTFGFGIAYSVSMLFGVLTKSAVASLLCTFIFLFANGCVVQEAWVFKEWWGETEAAKLLEAQAEQQEALRDAGDPASEARLIDPFTTINPWLRRGAKLADVLHVALPMTRDVELAGRELRLAAERHPYQDRDTGITLYELPEGAERAAGSTPGALPAALTADFGAPRLTLVFEDLGTELTLHRRPERERQGGRSERSRDAANALAEALAKTAAGDARRTSATLGSGAQGNPLAANLLSWSEGTRSHALFAFRVQEQMYALHLTAADGLDEDRLERLRERVDPVFGLYAQDGSGGAPWQQWYERNAGFGDGARFDLTRSLLRSLAFVGIVLLLGWRKLSRMDF